MLEEKGKLMFLSKCLSSIWANFKSFGNHEIIQVLLKFWKRYLANLKFYEVLRINCKILKIEKLELVIILLPVSNHLLTTYYILSLKWLSAYFLAVINLGFQIASTVRCHISKQLSTSKLLAIQLHTECPILREQ